ncbi:gamma-glutamylcyclotransferase [Aneurinibacillus sp. Ricciae_BoGa-3]|uniref:gamma-glutamylcyclotransferase family protein n=1 Tax=Aneurinibacillus sp. Ricciae_BoGa-3 TaxID=3022697 RepID=UPI0023416070|nr:gamma-glutamylcyclotransferase [Aneurinibacillus sp. Ricciae_BoGa-3]WCK56212.1 gamma-glutamylcyclotransferase [Aneurinibacillus sp. Ricciae_BoGa-3]
MYVFVYGTMRMGEANYYYCNSAVLIEENAWVKGALFDTGNDYAVMTYGKEIVRGELYLMDEQQFQVCVKLAEQYNKRTPLHQYKHQLITVFTRVGEVEAITLIYDTAAGFQKVPNGDWIAYQRSKSNVNNVK